ncbi:MAG: AAA family ATPase [Verrucomicrobia bacterium]|nr:AAA family ATPase [Verrucomicrobiota bacterium]
MTLQISQPLPPLASDEDRPSPGTAPPPPFQWNVCDGGDGWTCDPAEIAGLSDPPIIEGLLREREVATVVGAAKTAKTWFSLALALAVAAGEPFLGMATHRRKVLYLDYELKQGTFRKRMSLLSPDRPDGFFYQCLRGEPRLPRVDEIAALVEAEGYGLVVVDSLYRTGWLSEENSNDRTGRELTQLQTFTARTACTLVCTDHTAKGGGTDRSAVDAARGASAKGGFYDALLVLRPTDKGPDPEGNYVILDPVLRDWPRTQKLPLVSFAWTATSCAVEVAGEVERGESDATSTRILEVIDGADKGISRAAIVAECEITEGIARRCLASLVAKKRVFEFPDPRHKQRILYHSPDIADEPRQTPPNLAA